MCITCETTPDRGQPCPVHEASFDDAPAGYMADPGAIEAFVLGGNATFTLVSVKSGARYTYRVRVSDNNPRMFFVSTLVGPDNSADYAYVGFFKSMKGTATAGEHKLARQRLGGVLVAGKKGRAGDVRFAALDWFLLSIVGGRVPLTAEFWHSGRCARCNRLLTDPKSIASGFGPECATKI